jgi:glycosyltransferase involved in cell wall biosynthesis
VLMGAFNRWQRPLLIAGSGRDRERLEVLAGPTVQFLGYVPDADLPDLFARCRAFLFPGEEDFGIAPIQAMAAGRPVIAYAAGGALETVKHGQTGWLFQEQTAEAIVQAVQALDDCHLDSQAIRQHAGQYDRAIFRAKMQAFIDQKKELSIERTD